VNQNRPPSTYLRQPRRAASMRATSIFFIVIIASKARLASSPPAPSASVRARGVICQESPQRSLHHPHWLSAPPSQGAAFQCDRASDRRLDHTTDLEAFADRDAAQYLIRDRDSRYSAEVQLRIKALGIQEILTAPKSPWQNPYAERLIGSIRRECLNHYIILNSRHLKRTLSCYFRYYHQTRTHLSLDKQCPLPRETLNVGTIVAIPQLGGLHH
jgi:hypothetical protein